MITIDCRNMACPLPVVTVKRALEESAGQELRVLLDDGAPRENVARFAMSRGLSVTEEPVDEGCAYILSGNAEPGSNKVTTGSGSILLVASDCFGDGPEDLGRLLMKNYFITLLDMPNLPDAAYFINTGVLLTTGGSEIAEVLRELENRGVTIGSCGVCLDFFNRREKIEAGGVATMFTIAEALLAASSVIRI